MHQYLKAIGFENFKTKKDLRQLLEQVETEFTHQTVVSYTEEADFCELQKEYAQGMGITLCGELDEEERFEPEYYFPYFEGSGITTYADVTVEKKIEKEMYVGVGIRTQLWTNAPGSPASDPSRVDATTAVSFGVLPPEVLQLYRQNHQAAAYPVRCVKE